MGLYRGDLIMEGRGMMGKERERTNVLIPRLQAQLDRVPRALELHAQALDLGEGGFQAVPLRFVLFAARGVGEWVVEGGVVFPQRELAFGRVACE